MQYIHIIKYYLVLYYKVRSLHREMIVKNIMLSERSLRQEFIEYDTIHRKCWNKQRKLIYDGKKSEEWWPLKGGVGVETEQKGAYENFSGVRKMLYIVKGLVLFVKTHQIICLEFVHIILSKFCFTLKKLQTSTEL